MKKTFFFTLALLSFSCIYLQGQTAGSPTGQPVSSARGDVVSTGTSATIVVASDSVSQTPSGKMEVAPAAASSDPAKGPQGQPTEAVRKPD